MGFSSSWLLQGHDQQCPAAWEVACLATLGRTCDLTVALGCTLEVLMLSKHGTAFPLRFWRASSRKQRNKKVVAFKAAGESSSQETKVYLLYSCTEVYEQINTFREAVYTWKYNSSIITEGNSFTSWIVYSHVFFSLPSHFYCKRQQVFCVVCS